MSAINVSVSCRWVYRPIFFLFSLLMSDQNDRSIFQFRCKIGTFKFSKNMNSLEKYAATCTRLTTNRNWMLYMRHYLKDVATSVKLEIRLHALPVGPEHTIWYRNNFTLIWLAHAFGTIGFFARSLIPGVNGSAATLSLIVCGVKIRRKIFWTR